MEAGAFIEAASPGMWPASLLLLIVAKKFAHYDTAGGVIISLLGVV
jgi:hypothetical protein